MIALSIRQPWAWLILNAGKDIENRDWKTPFRGRCLIHASKSCTKAEYEDAIEFIRVMNICNSIALPSIDQLQRGGIVGVVDIVDCVNDSGSPWFMGNFGFVLRNPQTLPFVPWKGRLGFFNVPESVLSVVQGDVA